MNDLRSLSTPNTFVSSIEILEPELITMNGYNDRVETLPLLFPCLETIFLSFGYNEIKVLYSFCCCNRKSMFLFRPLINSLPMFSLMVPLIIFMIQLTRLL